ncbi:MAG: N-acetylmuramoyl-L-alanine amidase [Candidatus Sumerlaeaceae bacterium]
MKTVWFSYLVTGLLLTVVSAPSSSFGGGNATQPTICTRSCWGARSPSGTISQSSSITFAVIHHTAGNEFSTSGYSASKANVRAIQNFHMDTNGWSDIAYHFLVDKFGYIFEGRYSSISSKPIGAHTLGYNTNSIGFNCMGYFHTPYNNVPTAAMLDSLSDVMAWKLPTSVGASSIYGHRQLTSTACPGDYLYSKMSTIESEISKKQNGGAVTYYDYTPDVSTNWIESSYADDRLGSVYYYRSTAAVSDPATFICNTSGAGLYDIYAWWPAGTNRSSTTPFILPDNTTVYVNQQINGGQWNKIGTNQFNVSGNHYVKVSCWTTAGYFVMADGVKMVGPK